MFVDALCSRRTLQRRDRQLHLLLPARVPGLQLWNRYWTKVAPDSRVQTRCPLAKPLMSSSLINVTILIFNCLDWAAVLQKAPSCLKGEAANLLVSVISFFRSLHKVYFQRLRESSEGLEEVWVDGCVTKEGSEQFVCFINHDPSLCFVCLKHSSWCFLCLCSCSWTLREQKRRLRTFLQRGPRKCWVLLRWWILPVIWWQVLRLQRWERTYKVFYFEVVFRSYQGLSVINLHLNSCRGLQMWRHHHWKHPDCFQVRTAERDWVEPHGRQRHRSGHAGHRVLSLWEHQSQHRFWNNDQLWNGEYDPHRQRRGLSSRRMSMAGTTAFYSHFNKLDQNLLL